LAIEIAQTISPTPVYLDLESPTDLAKLTDPGSYFELHKNRLVIPDEVQRVPELFATIRGVIDQQRREGNRTGQFLILGSASLELLQQSSETLAGVSPTKSFPDF
jgi:predicted AAA+ superfamily ATPase